MPKFSNIYGLYFCEKLLKIKYGGCVPSLLYYIVVDRVSTSVGLYRAVSSFFLQDACKEAKSFDG